MTDNIPRSPRDLQPTLEELIALLESFIPNEENRNKVYQKIGQLLELRGALKNIRKEQNDS